MHPDDSTDHDNGILAQVPGQYVAAALQLLPPPDAGADQASVVRWRRGKAATVFWSAVRADLV